MAHNMLSGLFPLFFFLFFAFVRSLSLLLFCSASLRGALFVLLSNMLCQAPLSLPKRSHTLRRAAHVVEIFVLLLYCTICDLS